MPDILHNISLIDVLFIILLLAMLYKGSRIGVSSQLVSLVGYIALVYISIGYYGFVSEAIFGFKLQDWARPLSFCAIAIVVFVAFKFLERIFSIIAGEELAMLERVGGALVASFRAFMLFGVIGIALLLIPVESAKLAVTENSKFAMIFIEMDAGIYAWISGAIGIPEKKSQDEVLNEILSADEKKGSE
ncbi:MAG: CvpA family protein [Candidatus Omnitrophica bacterium]|nr:CvpA family protein [Candidatus Omnitrophota bacterium]